MILGRIKGVWDFLTRKTINDNFDIIEKEFNNNINAYSEEVIKKIIEKSGLIWKEAVDTYADIESTYPNPEQGWTVMSREVINGVSLVYRYDGVEWVKFQQISGDAINYVDDKLNDFIASLKDTNLINPDDYIGSDYDKLQSAVNDAISKDKFIKLERYYDLTGSGPIDINKGDTRFVTTFIGLGGGLEKHDAGYMFTSSRPYTGDVSFMAVRFKSTVGSGVKVINGDKIIRVRTNMCIFRNVDNFAHAETKYLQNFDLSNDSIVGGAGFFISAGGYYGITGTSLLVEHRDSFLLQFEKPEPYNRMYSGIFKSCLIEGLTGSAFTMCNVEMFNLDGVYLEKNDGGNVVMLPNSITDQMMIENCRVFEHSGEGTKSIVKWAGWAGKVTSINNLINGGVVHDATNLTSGSVLSINDGVTASVDPNNRVVVVRTSAFRTSISMTTLTMINGFTGVLNYGKSHDGIVWLEIRLLNVPTIAPNTIIATLPEGYRPLLTTVITVNKGNITPFDNKPAILIDWNGNIKLGYENGLSTGSNVNVDGGVSYRAR